MIRFVLVMSQPVVAVAQLSRAFQGQFIEPGVALQICKRRSRKKRRLRQIHPNSMEGDEPASDRFRPSASDKNKLSVDRSALTSAANAHARYVASGRKSVAVFGVSVGEFDAQNIPFEEDPVAASVTAPMNLSHALADYSAHLTSQQKVVAKRLKRLALARGCLHRGGV